MKTNEEVSKGANELYMKVLELLEEKDYAVIEIAMALMGILQLFAHGGEEVKDFILSLMKEFEADFESVSKELERLKCCPN